MSLSNLPNILQRASQSSSSALLETEGLDLLDAAGVSTPQRMVFASFEEACNSINQGKVFFPAFEGKGDKVVIKVLSREILHKSEIGGVAIAANNREAALAALTSMNSALAKKYKIEGYSLSEFVSHSAGFGGEFLFGLRWTNDLGVVLTLNTGGIYTEFLAKHFLTGHDLGVFSNLLDPQAIEKTLQKIASVSLATKALRGQAPRISISAFVNLIQKLLTLGEVLIPHHLNEMEFNPFVISGASSNATLVALDALGTKSTAVQKETIDSYQRKNKLRPLQKIRNLLRPESVALMGVSEKINPGRIILRNLLDLGFDKNSIFIVKPSSAPLDGCPCFDTLAQLPQKVDLLILAISAKQVPAALTELIQHQKAESVIVIPGGLEEKEGTEAMVEVMNQALYSSRLSAWQGPVINGGNCLGIRSLPGKYNTLFIPSYKMPLASGAAAPLALISQSGAFVVARTSKLGEINPRYSISLGNQMDLTIGDFLTYLKDDQSIEVFAVYVEGFKPLDGMQFLAAAQEISQSGRRVVLYRAGRTAQGALASASHTASVAGNYSLSKELCQSPPKLQLNTSKLEMYRQPLLQKLPKICQ